MDETQQQLIERAEKAERTLDNFRKAAIEIALHLASAGGMTHKDKNEHMMSAIARLLAFTTNYAPGDMDDLPF